MKCHEIPAADRQARGVPLNNFLSATLPRNASSAWPRPCASRTASSITLVTRHGRDQASADGRSCGRTRQRHQCSWLWSKGDEVVWAGRHRRRPGDRHRQRPGQSHPLPAGDRGCAPRAAAAAACAPSSSMTTIGSSPPTWWIKTASSMVLTSLGLGKRTPLTRLLAAGTWRRRHHDGGQSTRKPARWPPPAASRPATMC